MRLDRNINPEGAGKYALFKMRTFRALDVDDIVRAADAMATLGRLKLWHWGDEGPGEQFFVLKYKDLFAADALLAYAMAIKSHAERGMADNRMSPREFDDLMEYHREMMAEAEAARLCDHKIPD